MAGKGSAPRKGQYGANLDKYQSNYDRIFGAKSNKPGEEATFIIGKPKDKHWDTPTSS